MPHVCGISEKLGFSDSNWTKEAHEITNVI